MNRSQQWPPRGRPHIYFRHKRWIVRILVPVENRPHAYKFRRFEDAALFARHAGAVPFPKEAV